MEARRISGNPTKPGDFAVRSATDPEREWVVLWQSPKTHWCGCPAFAKANRCRHSLAVFAAIEGEWAARRTNERKAVTV